MMGKTASKKDSVTGYVRLGVYSCILIIAACTVMFFVYTSSMSDIYLWRPNPLNAQDTSIPIPVMRKETSIIPQTGSSTTTGHIEEPMTPMEDFSKMTLEEAVRQQADENQTIMLSLADSSYVQLAINLYHSYTKLGLKNYLFLTSDQESVEILKQHQIASVPFTSLKTGSKASTWNTPDFREKVRLKIKIVYEVLKLGYNVLLVDIDIVFLKNPFDYLTCSTCDLEIQNDHGTVNSGFFLVKPTKGGLEAFKLAYNQAVTTKKDDQIIVHSVIHSLRRQGKMKFKVLDDQHFPCGKVYFEMGHRFFAGDNPCPDCVIIHNNWIVSKEGKIYRFKEIQKWTVDWEMYYSNPDGKYLIYENPKDFGKSETLEKELGALKNALIIGHVLNRTVILPTFHCYGCQHACTAETKCCHLSTFIKLTVFDKYFDRKYREHTFFENEMVPSSIKTLALTTKDTIFLKTNKTQSYFTDDSTSQVSQTFQKGEDIAIEDIRTWLQPFQNDPVIKFHSLYDVFDIDNFFMRNPDLSITKSLKSGFKRANFRQF